MSEKESIGQAAESHLARLKGDIASLPAEIAEAFPPGDFLKNVQCGQRGYGFRYISPWQREFLDGLKSCHGPAIPLYHKFSLAWLMKGSLKKLDGLSYPAEIVELCYDWYERVIRDFISQPDKYYDIKNADFLQDRGICSLAAIPIGGVWIAEISAVSRKALAQKETASKTKASGLGALKKTKSRRLNDLIEKMGLLPLKKRASLILKKEKLFYHIHTYSRFIPRSAPEEMEKAYLRLAVLLLRNPKIQGIHRSTWLLDPQLASISPHLAYLRQVPEQNGAEFFRRGTTPSDREKAVQLSPTRKKLTDEGLYSPVNYAYLWPRDRVISWAEKHPGWSHIFEAAS